MADKDYVLRPLEHEDFVRVAVKEGGGPFPTMRDLFLFAAALGLSKGRKSSTQETSKTSTIEKRVFANAGLGDALITLCAIIENPDDIEIALPSNFSQQAELFVEYANYGLELMKQALGNSPIQTLNVVIENLVEENS